MMLPLNFTTAPYTGWTRAHWVALLARLTYGYCLAAERSGSFARALYPDDRRNLPDPVDALESFARIAAAWGAWLANPANPAELSFAGHTLNIETVLAQALIAGTDPASPHTYWGDIGDMDQRIVEAADVAVALYLSRERVFARMTSAQQRQIIAWLAQVDGKTTYDDNWILFPVMAMIVRHKLGFAVPLDELDARLDAIAAFYRGDGWYADGPGQEFDLYNAWMFGWHYLLWAWIDGDRRPDHREHVFARARSFLAAFPAFFGANGCYAAWGRSVVYRFAAVAAFATGHLCGVAPPDPGMLRRLSSGCLRYFVEHGAIDPHEHMLLQGFHDNFPPAGESYISPGSPSWACHGLFALAFSTEDPFWTAPEAPLPIERGDVDLALPTPGLVVRGLQATGQVLLLNGCSGHTPDVARHDYPPKYGKFAYSSHFPFNVAPAWQSYAPDAMLSLTHDGVRFGHRGTTDRGYAAPGMIWCAFAEHLEETPQAIHAAVLLWNDVQLRLAWIMPTLPVRAYEAPGALGATRATAVRRRSDPRAGWEYAEAEGRALAIRRLWGYDGQQPSAPFLNYSNLNLAYPYVEQPLVFETVAGAAPRGFASVSLVRPTPFDPAQTLAGFRVSAMQSGVFTVAFPDGEQAFVALTESPPQVDLGGYRLTGAALRCVRISASADRISAIGLTAIDGIVQLAAAGTLHMCHTPDGAVVTADTGLTLDPAWLGGPIRRLELQTLTGDWRELPLPAANHIPAASIRAWAVALERSLVTIRIS